MSTFLTQGGFKSGSSRPGSATAASKTNNTTAPQDAKNDQQLQSSLLYNPPVIVLEYLVPSTGKLYHHKMKLRQLKHDSDADEMLDYLKKRHPLYFMPNKLNHKQIMDLIKKLLFKVKQQYNADNATHGKLTDTTSKVVNDSKPTPNTLSSLSNAPALGKQNSITQQSLPTLSKQPTNTFKNGSQLPTLANEDKKGQSASIFTQNKQQKEQQKKFEEDFGDDFGDDFEDEEEDEEEEDEGDFDANELLNLTDYQNKRKQQTGANFNQTVGKDGAIEISNDDFNDDEGDAWGDDWGDTKKKENIDFDKIDYSNYNLNKLSTEQIEAHKKKMDEKFSKNQLKPGDNGFQYDKRIEFKKADTTKKMDTSWDEGEDVDEYFDDDFM
eukprot:403371780